MIALKGGTLRFSELRRAIGGVSERMLAQTLKSLESDGLVTRQSFAVVPPRVQYTLPPLGEVASSKVTDLAEWIEENLSSFGVTDAKPSAGEAACVATLPVSAGHVVGGEQNHSGCHKRNPSR